MKYFSNYKIRTSDESVWCTTQLAKLSFNHSIGRTHSWRSTTFSFLCETESTNEFRALVLLLLYLTTESDRCKVTGRRHICRVSPCRSAYFASPWWLLTLDFVDVVEKQLYYSQSRDGIWRCGSRPSLFMIIPNTKRYPNNTKTDQLPISEVITGLPRPHHNTS